MTITQRLDSSKWGGLDKSICTLNLASGLNHCGITVDLQQLGD
jgi:hypothetical protein